MLSQFSAHAPSQWCPLVSREHLQELPPPRISVTADKGYNFSLLDDAFIAQKKNHFQLTCQVCIMRSDRRNPRVWPFSDCFSADFGPARPVNQLYNNQKIDKLEDFVGPCWSLWRWLLLLLLRVADGGGGSTTATAFRRCPSASAAPRSPPSASSHSGVDFSITFLLSDNRML